MPKIINIRKPKTDIFLNNKESSKDNGGKNHNADPKESL